MTNYLIVGLGNIGDEYAGTRHNMGFRVLDALAAQNGLTFDDRRYGFVTTLSIKGRALTLLKPSTYMNLSGNAVRYWMQQKKIDLDRLLVVVDDLALPLGKLRLRPGGSEGGHNGLRHISQVLGTQHYARLRFGIGNEFARGRQVDWVLGRLTPEEEEQIAQPVATACDIIKSFALAGIELTMNQYNKK